ncbi:hypothetical protein E2H98_13915 [Permianibacter aggregans]|uniref:FimV-like protein n=2 Tax=Permianibacter aggregans TaxID=1510150 RepID=A0A4R6UBY9_9GAMM|nr:hypothetical protein E2H98_13915 [Permianibacter aggregans]TDQ43396.1 FimV-like protein [Permianibacter aggregans]
MAQPRMKLTALILGVLLSPTSFAVGLGDLELQSHLNETLQAEIPLLGVGNAELHELRASLGQHGDFAALGLDRVPALNDIRVQILPRGDGAVLQLSSRVPIREPLLQLVLVAEQGSTRYVREYALLLDLPGTPLRTSAAVSTTSATDTAIRIAPSAPAPAYTNSSNGLTARGDSLSVIAQRLAKGSDSHWQQWAVALFRQNPDAFIGNDPNRLKMAIALQLPTAEQVRQIARNEWQTLLQRPRGAMVAALQTPAPTPALVEEPPVDHAKLEQIRAQNAELKNQLQANAERLQALEAKLQAMDARQTALLSPQRVPEFNVSRPENPLPTPVRVVINDTLAKASPTNTVTPSVANVDERSWRDVIWTLTAIAALGGLSALFWTWSERRAERRRFATARVQHQHVLSESLPLPETIEPKPVDVTATTAAERRLLQLKQIQAAIDTYTTYQYFDRATELLQQEMQKAGDDLTLRRKLQQLIKSVRKQQHEAEKVSAKALSDAFDSATATISDKSSVDSNNKQHSG